MQKALPLLALGLLAACASTHDIKPQLASSGIDFAAAPKVEVKLSSFEFTPSEIHLKAGQPYTLVLTDTASGGHDFTAPEFFAAAKVAPEDAAKVANGQIDLSGGETATVSLVPAAGDYKLVCTHFGHAALGMTGRIIVE